MLAPEPSASTTIVAGRRRGRRLVRLLGALCLVPVVLLVSAWSLVPLWLPPVLDALLATQGYQLLSVAVARPGLSSWQVPRLQVGNAEQAVGLQQLRLGYRPATLWRRRLDAIDIGSLSYTRLPGAADTDDGGLTLKQLPASLEPEAWLQRLPWQSLRIARLSLQLPGAGVSAAGQLRQSPQHLTAALAWHGLVPPAGASGEIEGEAAVRPPLDLTLRYQAGEALRLALVGADGSETVRLSTRLGSSALDLSARITLEAAESRLLDALLGSAAPEPAQLARGRLALRARLPWPLPESFGPSDLVGAGDFDLALRLPEVRVPALAGVVALDAGMLRLTVDRLTAQVAGPADDEGAIDLQCSLSGPWPVAIGADGWTLGAGPHCDLTGRHDSLRLTLTEASGTSAAVTGRAALAGRLRGFAPDGAVGFGLRRLETGELSGELQLNLGGEQLPVSIVAAADGAHGEARFAHAYPVPARVLSRLGLVPKTSSDLLGGNLSYQGALSWAADGVTAEVAAAVSDLVLDFEALRTLDPPLALKPVSAQVTVALSPAAATFSGHAEAGALRVPFSGSADLGSGRLALTAPFEHQLRRPLFAGLFARWPQPVELDAGLLQGTFSLAVDEQAQWTLEGSVAGGAGQLDDSPFSGLELRWAGTGDGDGFELATPADAPLTLARLDPGFPLAVSALPLRLAGDATQTRLAFGAGRIAAFAGTVASAPFEVMVEPLDADIVLDLEGLALAELLALEGEDVRGTGVLDGRLPIRVRGGALQISGGQIAARPPGGTIALTDSLAQSTGQPGLDFALRALTDFRYSALSGDVSYAPSGELALALSLRGSNPAVEQGRAIQYNLNLTNNIPLLLQSLRADRVLTDRVEQRLNR